MLRRDAASLVVIRRGLLVGLSGELSVRDPVFLDNSDFEDGVTVFPPIVCFSI
jgi:hypothetical protein